ncbi:MAG: hypothetical protein AAB966_02415, partial [Patescibacteria group bacterium]
KKLEIETALAFIQKPESYIRQHFTKPHFEIWHELRGRKMFELNTQRKDSFKSISRTQTFTPITNDPNILFSKLLDHVEEAFEKARKCSYSVGKLHIFLKTQRFTYHATDVKLSQRQLYPLLMRKELNEAFNRIYKKGVMYRTTGCTLSDFSEAQAQQTTLFNDVKKENKVERIYSLLESNKVDFGTMLFDKPRMQEKKKRTLSTPIYNLG